MAGLVGSLTLLGGEHSDVDDDDNRANARQDHTLVILAPVAGEITGAVRFPNGIKFPVGGLTEWSASCCSRLLVCAMTFDDAAKALTVMEWHFNAAALFRVLDVLRELNVFAAELHSFGAFKVELREKLTNASHAQKALPPARAGGKGLHPLSLGAAKRPALVLQVDVRRCVWSADDGRYHASYEAGKPAVLPGAQVHGDASRRRFAARQAAAGLACEPRAFGHRPGGRLHRGGSAIQNLCLSRRHGWRRYRQSQTYSGQT